MIIIWGFRSFTKVLGSAGAYRCSHCGNVQNWNVVRIRKWFTIFWIPLIPCGTQYLMLCPICSYGVKLKNKEEAVQRIMVMPGNVQQNQGQPDQWQNQGQPFNVPYTNHNGENQ